MEGLTVRPFENMKNMSAVLEKNMIRICQVCDSEREEDKNLSGV